MWGVCATEPVGADAVVKTKSIQSDLEGTNVECTVRTMVVLRSWRLSEQRCTTISPSLCQYSFCQLKHEVCTCFWWLVWYWWVCAFAFESAENKLHFKNIPIFLIRYILLDLRLSRWCQWRSGCYTMSTDSYQHAGGSQRIYLPNRLTLKMTTPRSSNTEHLTALTLRRLMSYIYGAPILDVSRSHTTTQHSR